MFIYKKGFYIKWLMDIKILKMNEWLNFKIVIIMFFLIC